MTCNKETNLKNGWNRYCSFIKNLGFKNDTVFGLYLGCPCKTHDIRYSIEGKINSRKVVDQLFFYDILAQGRVQDKRIRSYFIAPIMWLGVRIGGMFCYKNWSIKGLVRYK